jgi:hypothetical protein
MEVNVRIDDAFFVLRAPPAGPGAGPGAMEWADRPW